MVSFIYRSKNKVLDHNRREMVEDNKIPIDILCAATQNNKVHRLKRNHHIVSSLLIHRALLIFLYQFISLRAITVKFILLAYHMLCKSLSQLGRLIVVRSTHKLKEDEKSIRNNITIKTFVVISYISNYINQITFRVKYLLLYTYVKLKDICHFFIWSLMIRVR